MATSRRLDAFDQWCLRRILRIPYTVHVTNEEVRRRTGQPPSPVPPYQGDYVCSDIGLSHELIHHKIIPMHFRQPSTVFQPTGAAGEADHVEPGSVPSSLICNRPTLASTRRGFAHKIAPNGVQLWRRLCSPLGVPPDDDDDDLFIYPERMKC